MHWWDGGWHMGGFMWLWALLLVAAVAAVAYYFARTGGLAGGGRGDSPEEILKRRYARGEIDGAEYEKRLEDLRR